MQFWNDFAAKKIEFDAWVEKVTDEAKQRIREKGESLDREHVQFWDKLRERFRLDPTKRYTITRPGEIYEVEFEEEADNPVFQAMKTYFDNELPPDMSDDEARQKLLNMGDPEEIVGRTLEERRKIYGDKIKPNVKPN